MRVLVDTCVIIDALQNREPFCEDAQALFLAVANQQAEGYLTAKSVAAIYYLTHRLTHSDRETRNILSKLFSLFELLDTTDLDCRKALSSAVVDYEDGIMVESALRSGMDCIVTRNTKDYEKAQITILTPQAFLQKIAPTEL